MDTAAADDGVVVDVVLEDGVLYLELANLADRPALNVRCSFDPPLVDLQGRDVSELRVFRRVEFLAARRRLRTLLDSVPGLLRTAGCRERHGRGRIRATGGASLHDDGDARPRALP